MQSPFIKLARAILVNTALANVKMACSFLGMHKQAGPILRRIAARRAARRAARMGYYPSYSYRQPTYSAPAKLTPIPDPLLSQQPTLAPPQQPPPPRLGTVSSNQPVRDSGWAPPLLPELLPGQIQSEPARASLGRPPLNWAAATVMNQRPTANTPAPLGDTFGQYDSPQPKSVLSPTSTQQRPTMMSPTPMAPNIGQYGSTF